MTNNIEVSRNVTKLPGHDLLEASIRNTSMVNKVTIPSTESINESAKFEDNQASSHASGDESVAVIAKSKRWTNNQVSKNNPQKEVSTFSSKNILPNKKKVNLEHALIKQEKQLPNKKINSGENEFQTRLKTSAQGDLMGDENKIIVEKTKPKENPKAQKSVSDTSADKNLETVRVTQSITDADAEKKSLSDSPGKATGHDKGYASGHARDGYEKGYQIVYSVIPEYPSKARRMGREGVVLVHVSVDALGNTQSASIKKSSGSYLLDDSALKAVSKWRFKIVNFVEGHQFEIPIAFNLSSNY